MLILDQALIWRIEATLRDPGLRCLQEAEQYCAQKNVFCFPHGICPRLRFFSQCIKAEGGELKFEMGIGRYYPRRMKQSRS